MPKAARPNKQNQHQQLPNQGKGRGGGKQQQGGSGGSVGSGKGDQRSSGKAEDGTGVYCPLCIEQLDDTERKFYPCPCGYQVCLFCYDKLRTECNKMCPGCRQTYDEDPSVNHPPPKPEQPIPGRVRPLSIPIYSKTSEHRQPRPAPAPSPTPFNKPSPVSNGNLNNSPLVQSPVVEHRISQHVEHRVNDHRVNEHAVSSQREQKSTRQETNKSNTEQAEKQVGTTTAWMPSSSKGRGQEQGQGQGQGQLFTPQPAHSKPYEPPSHSQVYQPPQPQSQSEPQAKPKPAPVPTPVKDPNVSNFLSMLRNQSDRNNEIKISDIKLDGNMAAIPPPPGFGGPPGFTTPNWSKPEESKPQLVETQPNLQPAPLPNPQLSVSAGLGSSSEFSMNAGLGLGAGTGIGMSSGLGLDRLIAQQNTPTLDRLVAQQNTPTPIVQAPSRYEGNPLGVIGSSRNNNINNLNINQQIPVSAFDSNQGDNKFSGFRDSNSNFNQSQFGTGSILNQLQALWKDDADNSLAVNNNNNSNINNNISNNSNSLFSGSLWTSTPLNTTPTPTPNPLNNNSIWQQPQTIQNGLNFGLDLGLKAPNQTPQNKTQQSLLWGLQNPRNGHRQQQFPQSLLNTSQINQINANQLNASQLNAAFNLNNNNNTLFMNQQNLLDNSNNNNSLLQGNNQNIQNSNQFTGNALGLGQGQNGGVQQQVSQQAQQQTHDLQMLLQQLQQGGGNRSTRSGGNGGGGLFSNFPGGV